MNKLCIVILVLGLMIVGSNCGRSKEKSKVRPSIEKSEKKMNQMEMEITGEWKAIREAEALEEEIMAGETEISDDNWDYDDESELFE